METSDSMHALFDLFCWHERLACKPGCKDKSWHVGVFFVFF